MINESGASDIYAPIDLWSRLILTGALPERIPRWPLDPACVILPVFHSCADTGKADPQDQDGSGYLTTVSVSIADATLLVRPWQQSPAFGPRQWGFRRVPAVIDPVVELDIVTDPELVSNTSRGLYVSSGVDIDEIASWAEARINSIGAVDVDDLIKALSRWFTAYDHDDPVELVNGVPRWVVRPS